MKRGRMSKATAAILWLWGKGKENYRDASDIELLRQQGVASYIMTPYVRKINYLFKALLAVLVITDCKKMIQENV